MKRSWIVVVVAACGGAAPTATPDAPPMDIDAAPTPFSAACSIQYNLHGLDPQSPAVDIDALPLDTTGVEYCLVLDATNNLRLADFFVSTSYVQALTSPFELKLLDAQGNLLRD